MVKRNEWEKWKSAVSLWRVWKKQCVKRSGSDSEELKKKKELICTCRRRVTRLKRQQNCLQRESDIRLFPHAWPSFSFIFVIIFFDLIFQLCCKSLKTSFCIHYLSKLWFKVALASVTLAFTPVPQQQSTDQNIVSDFGPLQHGEIHI